MPHPESAPDFQHLYESLLERSTGGVILGRPDGAILRVNPAACRMLRRTEPEVVRLGRHGIAVQDASLDGMLAERGEKGTATGLLRFLRGDGTRSRRR